MSAKHTKGPWSIKEFGTDRVIVGKDATETIALVHDQTRTDGAIANAKLIAAAPEMFEMLSLMLDTVWGVQAGRLSRLDVAPRTGACAGLLKRIGEVK